eukprot:1357792-Amorphochlora_amoeboformis.AAC.2
MAEGFKGDIGDAGGDGFSEAERKMILESGWPYECFCNGIQRPTIVENAQELTRAMLFKVAAASLHCMLPFIMASSALALFHTLASPSCLFSPLLSRFPSFDFNFFKDQFPNPKMKMQ